MSESLRGHIIISEIFDYSNSIEYRLEGMSIDFLYFQQGYLAGRNELKKSDAALVG